MADYIASVNSFQAKGHGRQERKRRSHGQSRFQDVPIYTEIKCQQVTTYSHKCFGE